LDAITPHLLERSGHDDQVEREEVAFVQLRDAMNGSCVCGSAAEDHRRLLCSIDARRRHEQVEIMGQPWCTVNRHGDATADCEWYGCLIEGFDQHFELLLEVERHHAVLARF